MKRPVKRTAVCPRCGQTTEYIYPELMVRFVNGGPITFMEGVWLLLTDKWSYHFGRKYSCPNCGKNWRKR